MIVSLKSRSKGLRTGTAYIAALLVLATALPLCAEQEESFFRDTWVAKSPEQGSIILLLKQNGRAAYFWADNADRSVYQGIWNYEAGSATLTWEDGSTHTLSEAENGFNASYSGGDQGDSYTSLAQKLPGNILGQWARPPQREADELSDREMAKGFFGIWKVSGKSGDQYIFVQPDRSAASTLNADGQTDRGLRGSWAKQGADLHIVWNSGHYSILRPSERSYGYKTITPGKIIEEDEQEYSPCTRSSESNVPGVWMARYKKERETPRFGVFFANRKDAFRFYRGDWIVKHRKDAYEKIEIGRFGGLSTSRNRDIEGSWLMSGQNIYMRWNDGIRRLLSPIADGFLLYEYKPGRPLDGIPTRIHPAAPADADKLASHLQNRDNAAHSLLEQARAAGIEPDESEGFGSSIYHWVWPFSGQEDAKSSPALLVEDSASDRPELNTPWWWPLWSEKQPAVAEESNGDTPKLAGTAPELAPETRIPEARKAESKNWFWPF